MPVQPDQKRLPHTMEYFSPSGERRSLVSEYGGIPVSDELREAIHNGNAYSFGTDSTIIGAIPASSSIYLLGITGDKQVHFDLFSGRFQKGGIKLWLYEDAITTANGTLQTTHNMLFQSSNISTLQLYAAPTITNNGNEKVSEFFPLTGLGVNVTPVDGEIAGGRVLKANTKYMFRVQNTDTSTCSFGVNFIWHDADVLLG